jgi:hypothetical protein
VRLINRYSENQLVMRFPLEDNHKQAGYPYAVLFPCRADRARAPAVATHRSRVRERVGFRLLAATPGGTSYPLMDDRNGLKEAKARLAATGVSVGDLEVVAFRPETVVESLEAFLEAGLELGARHTLVAAYDPDLERFSDRFAEYCEMAGRLGLTADLEFMPWTCVPDIKAAARIVDKVSSPAAGILVDALHSTDRRGASKIFERSLWSGCTIGSCVTGPPSGLRRPRVSFMPLARSACFRARAVSISCG